MEKMNSKRERGFTILEVVFAVSILAIGIMAYTILKTSNRYSLFYSKNLSQAVQLARSQLDDLRMAGFDSASLGSDQTILPTDFDLTDPADQAEFAKYFVSGDLVADKVTWTVRNECPTKLSKMVTYTIYWGSKTLTLTYVAVRS